MATKRKPGKRKRKPSDAPRTQAEIEAQAEAEDVALAEEILRVSGKEQADFVAGWDKFMKQLGITCKPIGAKKLREMAIKEGLDPEDNQFSRGIIEMREE
jgi:uncharacterized protein YpmB